MFCPSCGDRWGINGVDKFDNRSLNSNVYKICPECKGGENDYEEE